MSIKLWDWDKKPRTMTRFIKKGDIFCFRYDSSRFCFGRIIEHWPQYGSVVEIFDYISNNPSIDEKIIEKSNRAINPIVISSYSLFDRKMEGDWRIIGHQEDYKAFDYDSIFLTFGLDGDWKKKDLYGNITRIPDEEHYKYIQYSNMMDCAVRKMLKNAFGEPVEKNECANTKKSKKKNITDYLNINERPNGIDVLFDIENPKVMAISEEMNNRCSVAYMNGYNWDAFWKAYTFHNNPEILRVMETDPEAGSYSALFDGEDEETISLAKRFADIVKEAIENEDQIYDFLEKHKDEVEWD